MWTPECGQGYAGRGLGLEGEGGLGGNEERSGDEPMAPGQLTPQGGSWGDEAAELEEAEEEEEDDEENLHRAAEGEAGRGVGGVQEADGKGKEARVREMGDGRGKVNATIRK